MRMLELAPEDVWRRPGAHRRVGADARRRGHDDREGVPQRLQGGAAKAAAGARSTIPEKRWKFRQGDLDVRARFDDYLRAYEDVIEQTSSEHAPWYVVPADHNWVKATAVAELLVDALERIDPQLPEPEEGLDGRRDQLAGAGRPLGEPGAVPQARIARTSWAGQPRRRRAMASTMSSVTHSAIARASSRGMPHSASASNRARWQLVGRCRPERLELCRSH